jgi:RNA polymerase sigma-32 factor
VTSHLRLVAKIAMGYRGYGLPINEVIAEGNIGLMQAVKRFEPERGFRLATYAMWWIRAAIQEYILRSWSLVKLGTTAAQKKLFFNLRRVKGQIEALEEGDLRPEQVTDIANRLGVPEEEVVNMNRRLASPIPRSTRRWARSPTPKWQDWLADDRSTRKPLAETEELEERRTLLSTALEELTPRERDILEARRLRDEPMTLEDLSVKYDISRERVRQIEVRAFEKLQEKMKAALAHKRAETLDARVASSLKLLPELRVFRSAGGFGMQTLVHRIVVVVLAIFVVGSAYALVNQLSRTFLLQSLAYGDISVEQALLVAQGAINECKQKDNSVITRCGRRPRRSDALPASGRRSIDRHGRRARKKAYTARTFRQATSDWMARTALDAVDDKGKPVDLNGQQYLENTIAEKGGVPILWHGGSRLHRGCRA